MCIRFVYIFTVLALAFISAPSAVDAQKQNSETPRQQIRITSDNGEFSVEIPSNAEYFYDKGGFEYESFASGKYRFQEMQMLNGVAGETYVCVEIYRTPEPKRHLAHLVEHGGLSSKKVDSGSKNLTIRHATLSSAMRDRLKKIPVNFVARYMASDTHLYVVTVWGRESDSKADDNFISSIRFGTDQTSGLGLADGTIKNVTFDSFRAKTLRDVAGQLTRDEARQIPENPKWDIDEPGALIVLHAPWSGSIQPINNLISRGKVSLNATYGENGYVTRVQHISGLDGNPSRNALFALLRYKFLPKQKNGTTVSLERRLDFQF